MAECQLNMKFEAFKFLNGFLAEFLRAQQLIVPHYTSSAVDLIHESSRELEPLLKQKIIDTRGRAEKRD